MMVIMEKIICVRRLGRLWGNRGLGLGLGMVDRGWGLGMVDRREGQ